MSHQFQNTAPPVDRRKTLEQLKVNLKFIFEHAKMINEKIKQLEAELGVNNATK